jgi:hypothetical protein
MAKKTKGKGEEVLDEIEKDYAAADETVEESVGDGPPPVLVEKPHGLSAEVAAWPVSPDHKSARDVLLGKGAKDASTIVLDEEEKRSNTALNIVLLLLFIGVAVGGGYQMWRVGSPQALAAKKAAREAMEKAFMEEQLSKQKKYGVLRIESNPPQAIVFKDGEKMMTKKAETGEDIVVTTPTNMMDLDISQTFQIRIEMEGHDPFDFSVAPHIWTKDSATGEYKFIKMVELTPNICEHWFLYDAKKRKEVQFLEKSECTTYFDEASNQGVSVTECTCKIPPEGWKPPPGHPAAAVSGAAPGSAAPAPKTAPKSAP